MLFRSIISVPCLSHTSTWKSRSLVFFIAAALVEARVLPPPFVAPPEEDDSSPEPKGITVPPLPVPRLRNDRGLWCAVFFEYEKADTSMGFAGRVSWPPGRSCAWTGRKRWNARAGEVLSCWFVSYGVGRTLIDCGVLKGERTKHGSRGALLDRAAGILASKL